MKEYSSPRWTNEIVDCSMPLTFDTYSVCSYNCLYCFSFFQKSHKCEGYLERDVRAVNPEKVAHLFTAALNGELDKLSNNEKQFVPYIRQRKIMQWGGLADEFDEYERKYGVTLELLKFFDRIDYPLSFSTKATWWTEDPRYMEIFKKHTHNWHVKISIITANDEKARRMEKGVPASSERLKAMKRLADIGIHVTLRLRPYIIGLGDDWKDLIAKAKEAGADSVTTEFFCMESRADDRLKKRYAEMSKIVGYNIHKFYLENSRQSGYKRLSKKIKAPTIKEMAEYVHSLGLRFHVSDNTCRECNDACNCCGVPPGWNSMRGNVGQAILIAKEKGEVRWSDIKDEIEALLDFGWVGAVGYNTVSNKARAVRYKQTMSEFLRSNWNNVKAQNSPARAYGGILKPKGIDEEGNVIYEYAKENGKTKDEDR